VGTGAAVGARVGNAEGDDVGRFVGLGVGNMVGTIVGTGIGVNVGNLARLSAIGFGPSLYKSARSSIPKFLSTSVNM
jgi:hypothetical protein